MHLWRKNEKYAFIVFSYIVRLIFLNISRSGFKWFLVVLYLFFRKTVFFIVAIDEREANIFIVPVLMIFALSLAQYAWFVCGFPTDNFMTMHTMNLFMGCVGIVFIGFIGRDRWTIMISCCGN